MTSPLIPGNAEKRPSIVADTPTKRARRKNSDVSSDLIHDQPQSTTQLQLQLPSPLQSQSTIMNNNNINMINDTNEDNRLINGFNKQQGALLTEDQKKANHIASEKKRRQAIREAFKRLVDIVPDLQEHEGRSEATVLKKSVVYLRELLDENTRLAEEAERRNLTVPAEMIVERNLDVGIDVEEED